MAKTKTPRFMLGQTVEWNSSNMDSTGMPATIIDVDGENALIYVRSEGGEGWTHESWCKLADVHQPDA